MPWWGYYAIGCFWMFVVFWGLFVTGPSYAFARDKALGKLYVFFATYLGLLWCIYPIIWGLAEGSNTISVTAEIACYGALDIIAKVIFGFFFLMAYERKIKHKLHEERQLGRHDMSLLKAPVTAPLQSVREGLIRKPHAGNHHTDGVAGAPAGNVAVAAPVQVA